jgi:uroporphyrin-III C-methyltransferase/precorrin-2 dehydrogenase/sirohydrochlorin ferrochelatase/precorrin-2 dehydrogenase/sirohydrochlorin ferrochelatase
MAYFPMFVNMEDQDCLVVGGGAVALRKVRVLLDFGARVRVVAPQILPEIHALSESGVTIFMRDFSAEDLEGCAMVIAATDDAAQNHTVAELSKKQGLPVNAVDQQEDCTFIFPSYVREQNLVGAFSSGGNSPLLTQYLKEKLFEYLTEDLGDINQYMGSIRDTVKASVPTEPQRKKVYQNILQELLDTGQTELSQDRLSDIIHAVLYCS